MRIRKKDPRLARLRRYVQNSNLRMETIASRIGVSLRTVYNWIDDKGGVSPLASAHLDSFLADIETEVAAQRAREIQALTGESSNG
jgi:transposase